MEAVIVARIKSQKNQSASQKNYPPVSKKNLIFDFKSFSNFNLEPKYSAHEIVITHIPFYNMFTKNAYNFL